MFEFHHYGNGRFYWVVPEIFYAVLLFGGILLALIAIGAVGWGIFKKGKKRYFVAWFAVFLVSIMLIILPLNGVVVANTMFGG